MTPPAKHDLLRCLFQTKGLEQLWRARRYAAESGWEPCQFGVEVSALTERGLSITDLRWLLAEGYAAHIEETTRPTHPARRFRSLKALIFPPRTCLVLTDSGFAALSALFQTTGANAASTTLAPGDRPNPKPANGVVSPSPLVGEGG